MNYRGILAASTLLAGTFIDVSAAAVLAQARFLLVSDCATGAKVIAIDIVMIADTWHHVEDHISHLKKLRPGLRAGGTLMIIDFKKGQTPEGAPVELRLTPNQIESELRAVGYTVQSIDEKTLPYRYMIKARVSVGS